MTNAAPFNIGIDPKKYKAKGATTKPRLKKRMISVQLDPDQFEAIAEISIIDECSFSEVVRRLVEWGLETLTDEPKYAKIIASMEDCS